MNFLELVSVELLDREIDPQYLLDRSARLDILARTEKGTLINIEVQVANQYQHRQADNILLGRTIPREVDQRTTI